MKITYIPDQYAERVLSSGLLKREIKVFIALWRCINPHTPLSCQGISEKLLRKSVRIQMQESELKRAISELRKNECIPDSIKITWGK